MKRDVSFLLLQINDSLFPVGAYAHSYGLETYILDGKIKNEEEAACYMTQRLRYSLLYSDLLAIKLAFSYAENGDLENLISLSEEFEASRIPKEVRLASHKIGSRFVKTIEKLPIWQELLEEKSIYCEYVKKMAKEPVHHTIAYGVFAQGAGMEEKASIKHYLYAQTSAMVTTCVKTIPLSQTSGQQLLYDCFSEFDEVLKQLEILSREDFCLAAPGFDIRCMQHERLYSRLYMS